MTDGTSETTQTTVKELNIRWNLVPEMLYSLEELGHGMMALGELFHWSGVAGRQSERETLLL